MSDYRYDQSGLSKGLMGAGSALTGISETMMRAADLKKKSQMMDSQIKTAQMQYGMLKIKNIQSLPNSKLRYKGLTSKAGQQAWQSVFGVPMDEQTAKDYAEDYTSKLMIDMYEAMSGVDLNDPNAAGLISQAFVAIPGFKDDPAKAINAMNALRDYKKTEAGMLEDYATGELKRSQARKEGALADLYSQGKSPGWKNPAKPGTNRPVTNIQKFNALKGQLDIWSDQAQKAGDGMAKLKEKMADTKESNPELKSQEYIQYQNLYDEARREGQRIIDSIRTLQPLMESDPDGIYSAPNPQPAPGVKDIKRKKTQMERFEELTTGPDAVTNDEAYKTIAIELKNGLITK